MRTHGRTTSTSDDGFRRIEVITGVGRRRRWTDEEKAWIVAESLDPAATSASAVARRYGLHRGHGRPSGSRLLSTAECRDSQTALALHRPLLGSRHRHRPGDGRQGATRDRGRRAAQACWSGRLGRDGLGGGGGQPGGGECPEAGHHWVEPGGAARGEEARESGRLEYDKGIGEDLVRHEAVGEDQQYGYEPVG